MKLTFKSSGEIIMSEMVRVGRKFREEEGGRILELKSPVRCGGGKRRR